MFAQDNAAVHVRILSSRAAYEYKSDLYVVIVFVVTERFPSFSIVSLDFVNFL